MARPTPAPVGPVAAGAAVALAALVAVLVLVGGGAPAPAPADGAAASGGQPSGPDPAARAARRPVPEPLPAADVTAPPGRWVPARTAPIRPGVRTVTAGGGRCTSNFVFVAADRRFLGQAAHCAGTGLATEVDGCSSGTRPLGTAVTVTATDGSRRTGWLAYSSWVTMQARGERDPAACAYNDFALVELVGRDAAQVNPSLPGLGGPTGLRTADLPAGARVYGLRGPTPDAGTAGADVGAGFGHEIYPATPGVPGESGSGFVDGGGAAFGVLTTLNLSDDPVSNGTTDLAAAIGYASAYGGLGPVRLALGTEPFRPRGLPGQA